MEQKMSRFEEKWTINLEEHMSLQITMTTKTDHWDLEKKHNLQKFEQ